MNRTEERKCTQTEDGEEIRRRMQALPGLLLSWYPTAKRDLPWRTSPTPYRVWISEIMLQQTRIEAVKGYYERFLAAFPDVNSLAQADEEEVLKQWEGLGYYSRARNLHRAAKICRDQYGGDLPRTLEELKCLPGIGSYTAGAVGSISLGLTVPAVDGNVLRVMTRFLADDSDIGRTAVKKRMEGRIAEILPEGQAGLFNQALMELGETVCIPGGSPLCGRCPLAGLCLAAALGRQEDFPVKAPKRPRPSEERTILVLSCGRRTAIRKREEEGLLAGLYELPALPGRMDEEQMRAWAAARGATGKMEALPDAVHVFSHLEWRMTGWKLWLDQEIPGDWFYADADEIRSRCPLPAAFRSYLPYIS